ncbi:MAG: AbrB/MazE/SpoVT family DNA-binding domain-containing protein [Proteobacteria bacterium]|nr:AbrB/MazE/SpoVT family DNA-binding domain-containing protein [Pseudomonadota bacterium]
MAAVKVIGVGEELAVLLSPELRARLGVKEGNVLQAVEGPDGVTLSVPEPSFEEQMNEARRLMDKWQNVLRELAK